MKKMINIPTIKLKKGVQKNIRKLKVQFFRYRNEPFLKELNLSKSDIDDIIKTLIFVFQTKEQLDRYILIQMHYNFTNFFIYYTVYDFINLPIDIDKNYQKLNMTAFTSVLINDNSALHYLKYFFDIQTTGNIPTCSKDLKQSIRMLPFLKSYIVPEIDSNIIKNITKHAANLNFDYLTTIDYINYYKNIQDSIKDNDIYPDLELRDEHYKLLKLSNSDPLQMFVESYVRACRHIHNAPKSSIEKMFNSKYYCNYTIYKRKEIVANLTMWQSTNNEIIIDCVSSFHDGSVKRFANLITQLKDELLKENLELFISDTYNGTTKEVCEYLNIYNNPKIKKIKPVMKDFSMHSDTVYAIKI